MPLVILLRKPWAIFLSILLLYTATVLAIVYTSIGFPYMDDSASPTPQRIFVVHSQQAFYDSKGLRSKRDGFYVINLDRRIHEIDEYVEEMKNAKGIGSNCEEIFCGVPVFSWKMVLNKSSKNIRWIKSEAPVIYERTSLVFTGYKTVSKRDAAKEIRRLHFNVTGPDHMHLIIWPKAKANLVGWSFTEDRPNVTAIWDGRPVYLVNYVRGRASDLLQVHFDFELEGIVEVPFSNFTAVGQYLHDESTFTPQMKAFVASFPSWAHVTPWISQMIQREY